MALYDSPTSDRDNTTHSGSRAPSRSYSPVQALFLIRLNRLLRQRQDAVSHFPSDDWRLRLLSKAIYSTFCDCVELGIAEDARSLFSRAKASS
jgi:hypothetical protein